MAVSTETQTTTTAVNTLPPAELRQRIAELDDQRATREEAVAEARALQAAAERELADLEDRQVRGGANVAKEISSVEAQITQLGRQLRAQATARDRVYAETAAEHAALTAALPAAERRELEAEVEAERELADAAWNAARRRQIEALADLSQADADVRDARGLLLAALGSAKVKLGRDFGGQVDAPHFALDFTEMDRIRADSRTERAGVRLVYDRDREAWSAIGVGD
jgi:DNA repair exonuclease SbcCD ATPase subunit